MLLEPSNKPVLAWEREARFNFKKLQANVETRRGNKETLQSMCKAPLPPPPHPPKPRHSPTLLSTGWINTRNLIKNTKKHPRSFPQLPSNSSSPAPKGSQKATKNLPKVSKKHQKKIPKALQNPPGPHPRKVTNGNSLILFFYGTLVAKMDNQRHQKKTCLNQMRQQR